MQSDASATVHRPLRRSASDLVLLGVCAGLARTLDVRPLHLRIAAVLLAALAFPLLLVGYAALALIVPREDGRALLGGEPHDGREQIVGWTLVVLAGVILLANRFEPEQLVWPALSGGGLVLAALGIGYLAWRQSRGANAAAAAAPTAAEPATVAEPEAATASVAEEAPTTAAAAAPVVPGADAPGAPPAATAVATDEPTLVTPSADAVTAVSTPLDAVGRARPDEMAQLTTTEDATLRTPASDPPPPASPPRRRRRGRIALIALGVVVLLLGAFGAAGFAVVNGIGGIGDSTHRPTSMTQLNAQYRLGVGSMDIDLRELELPRGTTDVEARMGAGTLTVLVPEGVRVESVGVTELTGVTRVNRAVRAQRLAAARAARRARAVRRARALIPAPPVVRIDADVSLGSAEVVSDGG